MSTDNTIPVMKKPVDTMEVGANGNNLAMAAMGQHPIEQLQQQQGASHHYFNRIIISPVLMTKGE